MKPVEDQLRELGDHVMALDGDTSLPTTTLRRIKRRRRGTSAAGATLVSMLALTTVMGVINLTSPAAKISPAQASPNLSTRVPTASTRDAAGAQHAHVARDDFFGAVWPEDSREETSEGCSLAASTPNSFRTDPVRTAVEFGRAVLEWSDAQAAIRGAYRNSRQIELSRAASPGSAVNLSMVEYAEDCWSVQSVGTDIRGEDDTQVGKQQQPMGTTTSNTPDKNVFSVAFDAPAGFSGRIELAYGDYWETKGWSDGELSLDDPVTFAVGPFEPHDSGHYLIFFEDESGTVITAAGSYLNPSKGLARPIDASRRG